MFKIDFKSIIVCQMPRGLEATAILFTTSLVWVQPTFLAEVNFCFPTINWHVEKWAWHKHPLLRYNTFALMYSSLKQWTEKDKESRMKFHVLSHLNVSCETFETPDNILTVSCFTIQTISCWFLSQAFQVFGFASSLKCKALTITW